MRRGILKLGLIAVIVLALAATAAAYLSASGSGSGSGSSTATTTAVTLAAGTPTAELYPGGSSDVAVKLTNSNASPVNVKSLVLDTAQGTNGFTVDGSHSGCATSALSYPAAQTNGGAGFTVAPNTSLDVDLSGAVSMATSAADACQGAQFTVYLKVGS
jgi:hypothetical protein